MAKAIITVNSKVYQPGTRTVTLPDLTSDDNGVKIILTRESWTDTGSDVLSGVMEGSDDGIAWREMMRFAYPGGDIINPRTGQLVTTCGPTRYWDERDVNGVMTPQRPAQVRVTVTNTVALRTGITLQGA